jgi:hypothetical protein
MTTESPMTPADCDLRGMPYMPLHGDRLFGSATWIAASPEAKVAALRLWWRSFAHEVPAGSLPDDDMMLADYAGYGVGVKAWRKVKAQAMRGWILCTDGRLYHRTVAEVALEAWDQRKRNREKQARWRNKDRSVTPSVTVTETGTQPFRNAGSEGKVSEGSTEAKASGADAPKIDPVKVLFDEGVRLLTDTGTPEPQARSLIGRWRKAHGDDATRTAIQAAYDHGAIAPVEFITASLTRAPKAHETWDQRRIREAMEAIQ